MITELTNTEVQEVVVISTDEQGRMVAKCIAERSLKRKKRSNGLRLLERVVRNVAEGQAAAAAEYRDQHERSSRKRRDGALLELPVNVIRASRKGMRKAKLPRLIW